MSEIMNGRFSGKDMIVTGGARGIGAATAIRAAEEGAKVVLVDRLKKEGEETLAKITSLGEDAVFLHLDLSEEEASKEMVARTIEHFDRLVRYSNVLTKRFLVSASNFDRFECCISILPDRWRSAETSWRNSNRNIPRW